MTDSDDSPTDDRLKALHSRVAELEDTVQRQQETIQQLLPTRRQALKAGGVALGGAALFGAGQASAGTNQVGQIGSSGSPVDVVVEDLLDSNGTRQVEVQPGTLATPNAVISLEANNNDGTAIRLSNASAQSNSKSANLEFRDSGGTATFLRSESGEVVGEDSAGNTTILT